MALFLSDPGVPGVRSMGLGLCLSLSPKLFADLTDVTLAERILAALNRVQLVLFPLPISLRIGSEIDNKFCHLWYLGKS